MNGTQLSILLAVIVTVVSLSLIGFLLGRYIYKRTHHMPTGDCACCCKNKKKLLKEYHKANCCK